VINLMLDLVKRYPIDGVNLDYIRSMGICRGKRCNEEYKNKFHRPLVLDHALSELTGGKAAHLDRWNLDDVTDIVSRFSSEARLMKPSLIISVDGNPLNKDLLLQGQDSVKWANDGLVDVVYNMDYGKIINVDAANTARNAFNVPTKMIMLIATYDLVDKTPVPRDPKLIADYVRFARRVWPDSGIAFYHYPQLSDDHVSELASTVYRVPAVPLWRLR
jgi:uncharacterized lipoprotein YddW (UPF0748 family)